jgi:putative tryptophan/tyrosine transport system substrate-binding protein
MRRREVIAILGGGVVGWSLAVRAQQKAMPVIGYLSAFSAPSNPSGPGMAAFRQGLSDTGYVEGRNLVVEYRSAEGRYDRLPGFATELIGLRVDVIVAISGVAALAAKAATATIPIVFIGAVDPFGLGLAASIQQPGGNVTGVAG